MKKKPAGRILEDTAMTINTDQLLESILDSLDRIDYVKSEDIPDIQLYMDQVTTFMDSHLASTRRYPSDKIFGAGAAGIGMVLILYLGRKIGLNDFFQLLLASAVIAVVAYLAAENPYQTIQMDIVIIAAIMPIVPGAAITTAVRDTMQGDYVAGGAKALEAFVSAAAIAAGVSFGMILTGVM